MIKMTQLRVRIRRIIIHIWQILQKRFKRQFGVFSNLLLINKLNSSELYAREIPRLTRLLRIAKVLEKDITWADLLCFLNSNSELDQEFVAFLLAGETGFFVEFGAMDGIEASNTLILETHYGWRGILAEPNPELQVRCSQNRKSPCFNGAIIGASNVNIGELLGNESARNEEERVEFAQIIDKHRWGLSTLQNYIDADFHSSTRRLGYKLVSVPALTLEQLLNRYHDCTKIHFLSIDTEGSEIEIIRNFPFDKYDIDFISIEHNHHPERSYELLAMLDHAGYKVLQPTLSGADFWFVKKPRLDSLNS